MFDSCPKVNHKCAFATKSRYNVRSGTVEKEEYTYCGLASGDDTRAENLPKCWKDMTKYEQSKYRKSTLWGV